MIPFPCHRLLPAAVLALAGCAATPNLGPTVDPRPGFNPIASWSEDAHTAPRYGLLGTSNPRATVVSVVASSTRNAFFHAAYAVDGNFHSAWSPSPTDPHPSLSITVSPFDLGAGSILVKASHVSGSSVPIQVHFDIKNVGKPFFDFGGFQVTPGTPGFLDISQTPIATVEQVKATFNTNDLLVCEVEFFANHLGHLP